MDILNFLSHPTFDLSTNIAGPSFQLEHFPHLTASFLLEISFVSHLDYFKNLLTGLPFCLCTAQQNSQSYC